MDSVDLALVLALDGSASVTFDEFTLIVNGCAESLRDPAVAEALVSGPHHGSLVAVLLWSGRASQQVMVPWRRLGSAEDVDGFADALAAMPRSVRPGTTAIGAALLACEALLAAAPATSRREVIDVAGDGRNNDGPPPAPVRDRMAARGVMLNGLCVLHEEPDLLESYHAEVVAGPDAFALTCADYAGFEEAMGRKLLRETGLVRAGAIPSES